MTTIKNGTVVSTDGTNISYKYFGQGAGLLIVHGGFRASQHYLDLAKHLANDFTVYIMDRRGRNQSGPKGEDYHFQKEIDDIHSILRQHDIQLLFGHSFGALSSLNAASDYPLIKLAVYEPPLYPYFPTDWLPQFEREIDKKDFIGASVTFLKGMQMGGFIGKLPKPLLKIFFKMMAKGDEWEENIPLLETLPEEFRVVMDWDSGFERYKNIKIPTLIIYGTKTTDYLISSAKEFAKLIPNHQLLAIDGLVHNAPDEQAPEQIALELKSFFQQ
ncbi:alpha/beta fold hydrolase [Neobacillus drentensis]|uniref:alpha/beta fold hydrolase n=1 Tax=Neobacillus drentensis TaxID=220684 RepID=UPI0030005098